MGSSLEPPEERLLGHRLDFVLEEPFQPSGLQTCKIPRKWHGLKPLSLW